MNHLKSLTFTVAPKGAANPIITRRAKLVSRLEEQKSLAQDPNYAPTVKRWVKAEDGTKHLAETQRRISPWWRQDATGATVLTVRYGFKPIEFEKGKAGISVPSTEKLLGIIDAVISAIRAGELDSALEQQSRTRSSTKAKRAA